ncbi:unnamed protein product [Trichogramma brassicae]|uniref:Vps72/YL1 C-terminal domain-containing protein n=2 Tax=Trichogramma TaxID=7490 RepID=A0A6H5IVZ5_9HYME|nr:unnamed protein product [Trichogramma brassicae]
MVSDKVIKTNDSPFFKNSSFKPKYRNFNNSGKKRIWRSLKQILSQERVVSWGSHMMHYSLINSQPSSKPNKKYSDLSGLPALYTDPQTKLFYATGEEFKIIRSLPTDINAGYLALRGASNNF